MIAIVAIGAVTVAILAAPDGRQNEPVAPVTEAPTPPVISLPAPAGQAGQGRPIPRGLPANTHGRAGRSASLSRRLWPWAAQDAARRFLATYLRFTYAQLPAGTIQAVSPQFRGHIGANSPAVPEQAHRLHPRITTLAIVPARIADADSGWAATATVTDGLESYQVTVKLAQQDRRWLVTAILAP